MKRSIAVVCLAGIFAACSQEDAAPRAGSGLVGSAALVAAAADPTTWITHGGDYSEDRFSGLADVDQASVNRLGLSWSFDTGMRGGHEATPLVFDGVMYLTGPWSIVYALDAGTGALLWNYDPGVPRLRGIFACCDVVNRGVAMYEGRVFVGTLDGRLVALDAASGEVVWETLTVDQADEYTITGAPRIVGGRVVIGNGGAELGVRGYVSAYDHATGQLAWRTYTVPGDPALGFESPAMERAAETWSGEWWALGGGGTAWDGMAYDPALDLLYVGTGNGSPWNAHVRSPGGGDNLYLSSILALRGSDGELVWHYQTTPSDHWDFTATQPLILASLEIAGEHRDVLMQAPKNGFFYVLDRVTGELLSAENYVPVSWADGVDLTTGRPRVREAARYGPGSEATVSPSVFGGHNWQPMSYSPQSGLVYVPIHEITARFSEDREGGLNAGLWNTRTDMTVTTFPQGFLLAWDPVSQSEAWRVRRAGWWNGGVLSTAGGLVFQGGADGRLVAFSAATGDVLWESSTGLGIIAPPMTYALDGVQYLTVVAGWGGVAGKNGTPAGDAQEFEQRGRVLTFALDAATPMPSSPLRRTEIVVAEAEVPMDEASLADGEALFELNCSICHGGRGASAGSMPNLLTAPQSVHDLFHDIVLGGAREPLGMPSFAERLTPEQVDRIHAYLIDAARAAAGE